MLHFQTSLQKKEKTIKKKKKNTLKSCFILYIFIYVLLNLTRMQQ